jgi:superfamily II DNA/RNA helicase
MAYRPTNRSGSGRRNFSSKNRFQGGNNRRRGPQKENIDPSKFIQKAISQEEAPYEAKNTFADLPVIDTLRENIEKKGFTTPSPIQDQAILPALEGRDIIGIANTGTGKTLAFAIPVLQRLLTDKRAHALIMAPTRELAEQILKECQIFFRGKKIHHALLIGGMPMRAQLKDLGYRPQLVIGTPGRIKDHLERETIKLRFFNLLVLDEVDRMLDMGFMNDMKTILSRLAPIKQSFFFSATMDPKVRTLIDEFSNDPLLISVKTGNTTDQVEQNVIHYSTPEDKKAKLFTILEEHRGERILIFDETKHGAEKLSKIIIAEGFPAEAMHGNKSQSQRKRILDKFRAGRTKILVATDVAARGIDVDNITHVINYATPQSYSDYVHRIGRAGRANNKGYALTFLPEPRRRFR